VRSDVSDYIRRLTDGHLSADSVWGGDAQILQRYVPRRVQEDASTLGHVRLVQHAQEQLWDGGARRRQRKVPAVLFIELSFSLPRQSPGV